MKEIQHLKPSEAGLWLFLFLLAGTLLGWSLRDFHGQRDILKAREEAHHLGAQILQGGLDALPKLRHPSSFAGPKSQQSLEIGRVGQDPWGNPYRYRRVTVEPTGQSFIVVWSHGPNSSKDTDVALLSKSIEPRAFAFSGDDVGVVIPD